MSPFERPRGSSWRAQEEIDNMEGQVLAVGLTVAGLGAYWAVSNAATKLGEMSVPKNPDGQFEVVKVGVDKTIVRQDGTEYTISTNAIPATEMTKIIEANPQLKSFLENGPITIVDTNKLK